MRVSPRRAASKQRAATGCALLLLCCTCFGASASNDAMPDPSLSVGGTRSELTVIAEDVSLRDVLEYIAHHQSLSVEAHVPLNETITIALIQRPLSDVLRLLLRRYSFTLHLSNSITDGNRLWIYPRDSAQTPPLEPPDSFGVVADKRVIRESMYWRAPGSERSRQQQRRHL